MQRIMMRIFLIDRVIQEKSLYVYNMHSIEEKHPQEVLQQEF